MNSFESAESIESNSNGTDSIGRVIAQENGNAEDRFRCEALRLFSANGEEGDDAKGGVELFEFLLESDDKGDRRSGQPERDPDNIFAQFARDRHVLESYNLLSDDQKQLLQRLEQSFLSGEWNVIMEMLKKDIENITTAWDELPVDVYNFRYAFDVFRQELKGLGIELKENSNGTFDITFGEFREVMVRPTRPTEPINQERFFPQRCREPRNFGPQNSEHRATPRLRLNPATGEVSLIVEYTEEGTEVEVRAGERRARWGYLNNGQSVEVEWNTESNLSGPDRFKPVLLNRIRLRTEELARARREEEARERQRREFEQEQQRREFEQEQDDGHFRYSSGLKQIIENGTAGQRADTRPPAESNRQQK